MAETWVSLELFHLFFLVDFDNPIFITGDPWPTYHPQDQETDSLVTSGPPNLTIRTDSVDAGDTAERSPESSAEGGFELRRSYASCALGEGKKKWWFSKVKRKSVGSNWGLHFVMIC